MAIAERQASVPRVQRTNLSLLSRLIGSESAFQTKRAIWVYVFALPWILGLNYLLGRSDFGLVLFRLYRIFCDRFPALHWPR